jgi:hypothetical protein
MTCGRSRWSTWDQTTRCWSWTRPAMSRRVSTAHRGCAAAIHRHRREDRERPGRGFSDLYHQTGHTLIDRELYLPVSWTENADRCAQAGIPDGTGFATKTELAEQMIIRALDGGISVPWVAGDEVYGASTTLRAELENRAVGYVLAVACDHRVTTGTGVERVDHLAARLPTRSWQRLSAGKGAKGHRFYDWAWITIHDTAPDASHGRRWLLIRRNRRTGELAFYRCFSARRVPWPSWCGSPDDDGPSRNPSKPARDRPVSTSTRSAPGPPGTAGPLLCCWRTSSSPSPPSPNA